MMKPKFLSLGVAIFFFLIMVTPVQAGSVEEERARTVAENWIVHQVLIYDSWNVSTSLVYPHIIGTEYVYFNGELVGYNFLVYPQGHILIPARDELPPVKYYSDSSTLFLGEDHDLPPFLRFVLYELYEVVSPLQDASVERYSHVLSDGSNARLWSFFDREASLWNREFLNYRSENIQAVSMGPLMTSTWDQGYPYNLKTPKWHDGRSTFTGCVATAAGQIMRYYKWPTTGQDYYSYSWNDGQWNYLLSRDFSKSTYHWDDMPDNLVSSTGGQNLAVANLLADVGIAYKMNYGPENKVSLADLHDTSIVFVSYFRYKDTVGIAFRPDYGSESAWMKVFRNEVQKKRPALLALAENIDGKRQNGHAVVVDGYRDTPNEQVHINMGWGGNANGWYTTNNVQTGSYNFNWFEKRAYIGIEPDADYLVCGMNEPTPNTKLTSASHTFRWKPGHSQYWLQVGTTRAGSFNILDSGSISNIYSFLKVNDLPVDGKPLYARLWCRNTAVSQWTFQDYTYQAAGPVCGMLSPIPGSNLASSSQTFAWQSGFERYWLYVGSKGVNSNDLHDSGSLTSSSLTLSNLPTDGRTLNVRLWCRAPEATQWTYKDYTYKAKADLPGKPVTIAPRGNITTNQPTYTWQAVSGSTRYQVWVADTSKHTYSKWFSDSEAGCSGSVSTCSVTPAWTLPRGAARWWVQGWNTGAGYGPWSDPTDFFVDVSLPGKPVAVSPSGTITSSKPTYTWQAVSGAAYYKLNVSDTAQEDKINQWLTAAETNCAGGTGLCSVTLFANLAPGDVKWRVKAWNSAGEGPWSDEMFFIVTTPCGIITPSPGDTLTSSSQTFTWHAGQHRYWLYIGTGGDGSTDIHNSGLLPGETTSWTVSDLPTGGETLYARLYCMATPTSGWRYKDHTYKASGQPSKPVTISPAGTIYTNQPTFTWHSVSGATSYWLYVSDAATPAIINQWFTAREAGCATQEATTCSVTPEATLARGSAKWWLKAKNNAGEGPWSDEQNFSVSIRILRAE